MSRVKIMGGPMKEPPKPVGKAEIQGQGSIPYAQTIEEPTPDTMFATVSYTHLTLPTKRIV